MKSIFHEGVRYRQVTISFQFVNKFKSGLSWSSRCSKKQSNANKKLSVFQMITNEKDFTW